MRKRSSGVSEVLVVLLAILGVLGAIYIWMSFRDVFLAIYAGVSALIGILFAVMFCSLKNTENMVAQIADHLKVPEEKPASSADGVFVAGSGPMSAADRAYLESRKVESGADDYISVPRRY